MARPPITARGSLSRAFLIAWVLWYLLSLPFTVSVFTDFIARTRARAFLFNVHDTHGLLLTLSALATYSQYVFLVLLAVKWASDPKREPIQKATLTLLSLAGCAAVTIASRA